MAIVYDHLGRLRFAIKTKRQATLVGGGVDVQEPEPVDVDGGKVTVGRSVEFEIATFVSVSELRTPSIVGGGVNVDEPDNVTVDGGTESVGRSVSVSSDVDLPSIDKSVSVSRMPSIVGGGVNVDEPEGVEIDGGSESVGRSVSVSTNVEGANDPPNASLSSSSSGNTIEWDATGSSDPNGDPLTFYFDFGNDGTTDVTNTSGIATQRVPDGFYICEVTVEDSNGATSSVTGTEQVSTGGR